MQDIHTHILFGVDDGAKTLDVSKELLKLEEASGVDEVICTPHVNYETKKDISNLRAQFEILKKENPTNIKLLLGSEIYYYDGLVNDLKNGNALTFNDGKYVLVEFSTRVEMPISDIVYEIKIAGFKPIVAHVERYPYLKKDDYYSIISSGALLQINARSVTDKMSKKLIKFLLKNDLVSFVASDCHNTTTRSVDFEEAKKFIAKKYKNLYDKLFNQNIQF